MMKDKSQLKLFAKSIADLKVISALSQDSVGKVRDLRWGKKDRSFSVLMNRLRWEDRANESDPEDHPKRSKSILLFRWVVQVKSRGFLQENSDDSFSLLSIKYRNRDNFKMVKLIFSGEAEIFLEVEYLEAFIKDIGKPYLAKSVNYPAHEI